jgi:hypothetical protein
MCLWGDVAPREEVRAVSMKNKVKVGAEKLANSDAGLKTREVVSDAARAGANFCGYVSWRILNFLRRGKLAKRVRKVGQAIRDDIEQYHSELNPEE